MATQELINAYKNARNLIAQTPADKDKIINDYIDLVVKINDYNTNNTSIKYDANSQLGNMLKNPLEISIYNNFQRYGTDYIDQNINNRRQQNQPTYNESANFLVNMSKYAY
jgi:hypothetical protein